MKITVFGATGGIGKWVVRFALDKGYDVRAYVRNPSKIDIESPRLEIIKGEVNDYDSISNTIKGCDAVINALGLSMKPFQKDFPAVRANDLIIKAMQSEKVRRYITWATPSVKSEEDSKSYITVLPSFLAGIMFPAGKRAIVKIVEDIKKSGLDWTVVRFMAPKDTEYKGTVKISFGKEKLSFNIARADIAAFMVDQIKSETYIHKMPIIGS